MKYSPPTLIDLGSVATNTLAGSTVQVIIQKSTRPNNDAKNGLGILGPGSNPIQVPVKP